MRKVMKWVGIGLGGVLGLLILVMVGLMIYSQLTYKQTVKRSLFPLTADTSPEGVARGEYLVKSVLACGDCHSTNPQDPILSGQATPISQGPLQGMFSVPNLTPDMNTGLGSWSDSEIARAIREGVDKNGVTLLLMPSKNFHILSDNDVAAIIGYLRSLEPVNNSLPPMSTNIFGKAMITLGMLPKSLTSPITASQISPKPGTPEYGAYLTGAAGCVDCHGQKYTGGRIPGDTSGFKTPNITGNGVISTWNQDQFLQFFRTGVTPAGIQASDEMPWRIYGKMHDEDLIAIFNYLKSLPPSSVARQ